MHRHATYENGHQNGNAILQFIVTQNLIFSLAEKDDFVIFDVKSTEVVKRLNFEGAPMFDRMMHPVTYVNKLLFYGGKKMQLWNVIQGERIYEFNLPSEVESVDQSPVVDLVSVGLNDGSISMVNLLFDETLFSFQQKQGPILATTFLTDAVIGVSLMASACKNSGTIVLWDLNAHKIWAEMTNAHNGRRISSL